MIMNRFILLSIFLLLCGSSVIAQDTIFSKRYEPLIGEVTKVGRKLVYIHLEYKPKSSLFSIKKNQVRHIHYSDGRILLINPVIKDVSSVAKEKKADPPVVSNANPPIEKPALVKEVKKEIDSIRLEPEINKEPVDPNNNSPKADSKYEKKVGLGVYAGGFGLTFDHALSNPNLSLEARVTVNPGSKLFEHFSGNMRESQTILLPENQQFSYRDDINLANNNQHYRMDQVYSIHLNYRNLSTKSKIRPFATLGLGAGSFTYLHATTIVDYLGSSGPEGARHDEYTNTRSYEQKTAYGSYYTIGCGLNINISTVMSINAALEVYAVDYRMPNRNIKINNKGEVTTYVGYNKGIMLYPGFFIPVSIKFTL
jgi:hypothetical protein